MQSIQVFSTMFILKHDVEYDVYIVSIYIYIYIYNIQYIYIYIYIYIYVIAEYMCAQVNLNVFSQLTRNRV